MKYTVLLTDEQHENIGDAIARALEIAQELTWIKRIDDIYVAVYDECAHEVGAAVGVTYSHGNYVIKWRPLRAI